MDWDIQHIHIFKKQVEQLASWAIIWNQRTKAYSSFSLFVASFFEKEQL